MLNPRVDVIARFVREDPILYSHYLLTAERVSDRPVDSFESYLLFVLWFIVEGRAGPLIPVVLDETVRDAVTTLDPDRCHALMYFLAGREGIELRGDDLRAWYYGDAVPRLGLGSFLGSDEIRLLGHATSGIDRLLGRQGAVETDPAARTGFRDHVLQAGAKLGPVAAGPRVAIIGFHRSVMGLGEDARCLFDCLCEAGLCAELVDVSPASLDRHEAADRYAAFEAARPTAPILIFCMPGFEMMRALPALGLTRLSERQYRIGYWPWETTALAENWRHCYALVDEVWASSRFLEAVYGGESETPVAYMPLHVRIEEPVCSGDLEAIFGEAFTFLAIFDFNSRVERKNPLGAIEAFRRAFPREIKDVQLVLKTLHGQNRQADLDAVSAAAADDDRIVIIDGALPKPDLCGLIVLSDVYLSLHRSEGFGRPIAEAMLLRTPVVATGWSGCADFLTTDTGYPVRSTLRDVQPGEYPFAAGRWAEPDLDHAAALMRQLYDRQEAPPALIEAAVRTIEKTCGLGPASARVRERLSRILEGDGPQA